METKLIVSWLYDKAARAHDHSYARMLNMTAKRLRELDDKQRWIPVTERLPEKITNKVIVRCQNDYIGFGHYEDYKGKRTWYNLESDRPFTDWDLEDCESYAVTHWMPLPEPPKEVDNG
jgi:hypothetical protein